MFRKQISPKVTAVAVILILGLVQFAYWRLLVYEPEAPAAGGGGGGGPMSTVPSVTGREDIEVRTFAGDSPGYRDGSLWEARFCGPNALALGADGSLYVADSRNHRIRCISPDRKVTTIAGGGTPDGAGGRADGAAEAARFRFPSGVAVLPDGSLLIADTGNHRICRLTDGQVTTVAGGDAGKADGVGARARFRSPGPITVDDNGITWIADLGNGAVRRMDAAGVVSTPEAVPGGVTAALGEVARSSVPTPVLAAAEGRGMPAPTEYTLGRRSPGARLGDGAVLFADTEYGVLMVSQPGLGTWLAAGRRSDAPPLKAVMDGSGMQAAFGLPCAAVQAPDGSVYVADYEASVIRQVQLPEWLRQGGEAPAAPRWGRRRMRRER